MNNVYSTARLSIQQVTHQPSISKHLGFLESICGVLTPNVIKNLPPNFQGIETPELALQWLIELQSDSQIFALCQSQELVGFIVAHLGKTKEVHIGYLLAESHWHKGFAKEALAGFIQYGKALNWNVLIAGVSPDNQNSIKLLEKLAFEEIETSLSGDRMFKLNLTR